VFTDAGSAKAGHTAIVTGANHGIGAATAHALARRGSAVVCTFLRVDDAPDPGTPQAYRDNRARDAADRCLPHWTAFPCRAQARVARSLTSWVDLSYSAVNAA